MLQKVNTVMVGTGVNATGTTITKGQIFLTNENGTGIALANIANYDKIQVHLAKEDGEATEIASYKSQMISKSEVKSYMYSNYVAKTEASATINFTNVTLVDGYRYVIRIVYRDIYEHPGQFTHSYEVIANSADTIDTVGQKFADRISAHAGARVTASYNSTTNILTLNAKEVVLNGFSTDGKDAITPYSQVQMKVVAYYTNPSSFLSNSYNQIPGISITNVESKPGKGNPYVVRDREKNALAYLGITYRRTWPVIKPELNVDLSETYDSLVIEFSNKYQSPDNQYVKSTDLASEVYVPAGDGSALDTAFTAWLA